MFLVVGIMTSENIKNQLKSYKTEIRLNQDQKKLAAKTFGTVKYIYNFFIRHNKEVYESSGQFVSAMSFSKWVNNEFLPNNPEFGWIKEVGSKPVKQAMFNAEKSFKNFFKKVSAFPKFKKRNHSVGIYFPQDNCAIKVERHKIKIPTFGWVELKEYGYIPTENISSLTITKEADRYFVSVLVKEIPKESTPELSDIGIGIDLGIKVFMVASTGEVYNNLNKTQKIKKITKKLKRKQRSFARKLEAKKKDKSDKKIYSNLDKNKLEIAKLFRYLKNIRLEYVKYCVSHLLSQHLPRYVAVEDLNVSGMMKNRCLSKDIQNQNWYYTKQFIISKCKKLGIEVRLVDRFYASSKTCHSCGSKKKDLDLNDRIYQCNDCGFVEDRDLNAAYNIRDTKAYTII